MINSRNHILKITIFAVLSIIILAVFYISCGGGGGGGGGGAVSFQDKPGTHNGGDAGGWGKGASNGNGFGGSGGLGSGGDTEITIKGNTSLNVSSYTYNGTNYSDITSLMTAMVEAGISEDITYVDFMVDGETEPRTMRIRANGAANPDDDITIDYQYKATYTLPTDEAPHEVFYYKRDGIPLNLPPLSSSDYTTPVNGIVYHANKYSVQGQVVSSGNVRINSSGDVSFDIMPTGDTTYGFRTSDNTLVVNQTSGTVVIDSTDQNFEKIELPASAADGSITLDLSSVSPLNLEGAPGTPDENNPGQYIPHPAITNGSKIGAVTLPVTPFAIKTCAFQCCDNITSVDLSNCTSIGEGAFNSCTRLTNVDLSNCTTIGDGAFQDSGLSGNLDLSNCASLGRWVFKNCSGITSVTLSSSCTSIGWSAFEECTGLTSINLSGCTTIGDWAFRKCTALTDIDLSSCTSIGISAFRLCDNLTSVTFGNNITTIATGAFLEGNTGTIFNYSSSPLIVSYPHNDPTDSEYEGSPFPNGVTAIWDDGIQIYPPYTWNESTSSWD